jgi:predicted transport protein
MPIYHIDNKTICQIKLASFKNERELQRLFEANLETLLGVSFIGSEFTTGDRQRGRIDTLGIDQNGVPTIIEYKKLIKENVINQGLYYLDWLVDHKGDFTVAVQKQLGQEVKIDWNNPRLILIAEEFTEYDKYAVNRMGANIELWVYRLYADGILYLEPIFVPGPSRGKPVAPVKQAPQAAEPAEEGEAEPEYDLEYHLAGKPDTIRETMALFREQIFALGEAEEIVEKVTKVYVGYRHGKNFCEVAPLQSHLKLWLDIDPAELNDPQGCGRDVTHIGHHGTGQVEVKLKDISELEYVMGLVRQAYLLTV